MVARSMGSLKVASNVDSGPSVPLSSAVVPTTVSGEPASANVMSAEVFSSSICGKVTDSIRRSSSRSHTSPRGRIPGRKSAPQADLPRAFRNRLVASRRYRRMPPLLCLGARHPFGGVESLRRTHLFRLQRTHHITPQAGNPEWSADFGDWLHCTASKRGRTVGDRHDQINQTGDRQCND